MEPLNQWADYIEPNYINYNESGSEEITSKDQGKRYKIFLLTLDHGFVSIGTNENGTVKAIKVLGVTEVIFKNVKGESIFFNPEKSAALIRSFSKNYIAIWYLGDHSWTVPGKVVKLMKKNNCTTLGIEKDNKIFLQKDELLLTKQLLDFSTYRTIQSDVQLGSPYDDDIVAQALYVAENDLSEDSQKIEEEQKASGCCVIL